MRKIIALAIVLAAVATVTACKKETPKPTATPTATVSAQKTPQNTKKGLGIFSVLVEGASSASEFNQDYYSDLSESTATLTVSGTGYTCKGVYIKDILTQLGASTYTSVTVVGVDGSKQTLDKTAVADKGTMFIIDINGSSDDCPAVFCATKNAKVMNVTQIIIK